MADRFIRLAHTAFDVERRQKHHWQGSTSQMYCEVGFSPAKVSLESIYTNRSFRSQAERKLRVYQMKPGAPEKHTGIR